MKLQDILNKINLPKASDIVIIGGGVIGCSIAMQLSKMSFGSITLLEMNAISSGATSKSGAMIREFYQIDFLIEMAKESKKFFEQSDINFIKNGRIYLFSKENTDSAYNNAILNKKLGVNIDVIDIKQIKNLIPEVNIDDISIGLFEPEAGYVDSVETTYKFAQNAINNGVQIFTNTKAESIEINKNGIQAIKTNKGKIKTKMIINASGAWANYINKSVDENLPIFALRVQQVILKANPAVVPMHYCLMDYSKGTYLRPDYGQTYIAGEELGFEQNDIVSPDYYNQSSDHDVITEYKSRIVSRLPSFDNSIIKSGHAAIYDMTPDANPILGASSKIKGLFYAVGFSGHGFKLSPIVGNMIAELITKEKTDPILKKFNLSRFALKNLILPKFPIKNPNN